MKTFRVAPISFSDNSLIHAPSDLSSSLTKPRQLFSAPLPIPMCHSKSCLFQFLLNSGHPQNTFQHTVIRVCLCISVCIIMYKWARSFNAKRHKHLLTYAHAPAHRYEIGEETKCEMRTKNILERKACSILHISPLTIQANKNNSEVASLTMLHSHFYRRHHLNMYLDSPIPSNTATAYQFSLLVSFHPMSLPLPPSSPTTPCLLAALPYRSNQKYGPKAYLVFIFHHFHQFYAINKGQGDEIPKTAQRKHLNEIGSDCK